jgi:hypothetical protein
MQTSLFRKSGQSIKAPGTRPALTDMSAGPDSRSTHGIMV